jgi:hypothetical protein
VGSASDPLRPRSRYTGHDPRTSSRLSGVTGNRPSTTASASDIATRDTGTRRSEPSPRNWKTTLPQGTVICGVHSCPAGTRIAPHHQPWRARSRLHRWPGKVRSWPRTLRNEPHRQPWRLLWSEPHRQPRSPPSGPHGQPRSPPSGPHGQPRRARRERSKRPLVTASGWELGSATAYRTHERISSSPPPRSRCSR